MTRTKTLHQETKTTREGFCKAQRAAYLLQLSTRQSCTVLVLSLRSILPYFLPLCSIFFFFLVYVQSHCINLDKGVAQVGSYANHVCAVFYFQFVSSGVPQCSIYLPIPMVTCNTTEMFWQRVREDIKTQNCWIGTLNKECCSSLSLWILHMTWLFLLLLFWHWWINVQSGSFLVCIILHFGFVASHLCSVESYVSGCKNLCTLYFSFIYIY